MDDNYDYHVAGTGDDIVTDIESVKFVAGLINGLLKGHNLTELDSCIKSNPGMVREVARLKI